MADEEKVLYFVTFKGGLPENANPDTQADSIAYNETLIFWVRDGKIYKARTAAANFPLIKQVTGFEGSFNELIEVLNQSK